LLSSSPLPSFSKNLTKHSKLKIFHLLPPKLLNQTDPKALFASWVLEGNGGEGKAYVEVNPCLGVLKNKGKVLGGFEGLHLSNFKVLPN